MATTELNEIINDGLEKVSDSASFLGVSRAHVYKLLRLGLLPSVKIGKCRRVPIRAVRKLASDQLAVFPAEKE